MNPKEQKFFDALRELEPLIEQAKKVAPDLELPVIKISFLQSGKEIFCF